MSILGDRINSFRKAGRLTLEQLGRKVGVSGSTIRNWEKGSTIPIPPHLEKLADELGVSVFVLSVEQPEPQPNGSVAIWDLVIADMRARDHIGRERYGTPLQAFNGRDALRDAYEEALDLAVYLRTAIEERARGRNTEPESSVDGSRRQPPAGDVSSRD